MVWQSRRDGRTGTIANGLNNLAVAMSDTRAREAEALHREVLATRQKEAGPEVCRCRFASLTWLGQMRQGEYAEAEELLVKAKEIRDKSYRLHPQRLSALNNQAILLSKQGRYAEAAARMPTCSQAGSGYRPDHPKFRRA